MINLAGCGDSSQKIETKEEDVVDYIYQLTGGNSTISFAGSYHMCETIIDGTFDNVTFKSNDTDTGDYTKITYHSFENDEDLVATADRLAKENNNNYYSGVNEDSGETYYYTAYNKEDGGSHYIAIGFIYNVDSGYALVERYILCKEVQVLFLDKYIYIPECFEDRYPDDSFEDTYSIRSCEDSFITTYFSDLDITGQDKNKITSFWQLGEESSGYGYYTVIDGIDFFYHETSQYQYEYMFQPDDMLWFMFLPMSDSQKVTMSPIVYSLHDLAVQEAEDTGAEETDEESIYDQTIGTIDENKKAIEIKLDEAYHGYAPEGWTTNYKLVSKEEMRAAAYNIKFSEAISINELADFIVDAEAKTYDDEGNFLCAIYVLDNNKYDTILYFWSPVVSTMYAYCFVVPEAIADYDQYWPNPDNDIFSGEYNKDVPPVFVRYDDGTMKGFWTTDYLVMSKRECMETMAAIENLRDKYADLSYQQVVDEIFDGDDSICQYDQDGKCVALMGFVDSDVAHMEFSDILVVHFSYEVDNDGYVRFLNYTTDLSGYTALK